MQTSTSSAHSCNFCNIYIYYICMIIIEKRADSVADNVGSQTHLYTQKHLYTQTHTHRHTPDIRTIFTCVYISKYTCLWCALSSAGLYLLKYTNVSTYIHICIHISRSTYLWYASSALLDFSLRRPTCSSVACDVDKSTANSWCVQRSVRDLKLVAKHQTRHSLWGGYEQ